MKVRLFDSQRRYVVDTTIPTFKEYPQAIVWGYKVYVKWPNHSDDGVYREESSYFLQGTVQDLIEKEEAISRR
jgi:hypothetical protein